MARYRIGNDMTILWTVNSRDGSALPLKDKEVHLYYTCERGRFEADFEIQETNVVAWNFLGKNQRTLGDYSLSLEILQSDGKRTIKMDKCNAFSLVGRNCEELYDNADADINEGGELTIVSNLDIYRISPIIPKIGENSNWHVDGTDTGKPSTGKSAYEYAKEKGYEGTESEYAESLKLAPENAEKLAELSQGFYPIEASIQTNENDKLYIVDANGNILAEFNRDGLRVVSIATQLHYEIEDGYNGLRIVDANGNIIASIGGNGVEFAGQDEFVKNALLEYYSKKNTAAICWVDDDFIYSAHQAIYERMREFCISKNIRVDLAVGILSDTNLEQAKKWEEEGFDFLLHPQHDGWYDDPNVGYEHDITKVKKNFVQAARFHMTNFINKRNILIYPGSSNFYADNVEYIKDYVECAITATYYGSNHSNIENRYQLKRMSISLSADNTKSKIKARIKDAVANGDWIILYTHIYNFQNTDVVDEVSNSFANMCEIVEYANSLCPITHTQSIWEDRKKIYNF